MKRLVKKSGLTEIEKKIKEIQETISYGQNFTLDFQNIYNEFVLRLPLVKTLLDVQGIQIYQIMIEKLKRNLISFNKSTIMDKLNLLIQNITLEGNNYVEKNSTNLFNDKKIYKKSQYSESIVEQAQQLKEDLLYLKDQLFNLYKRGEILAEKVKKLLDYHSKNSVLKRLKNIKKVVRWIENKDTFDTDIIGRLDRIIYGDIPTL